MLAATTGRCRLQGRQRQGGAWLWTASCAWRAYLGELVEQAWPSWALCTNGRFSFTAEDVGNDPRPVLYNNACAVLRGPVLADALLECLQVVGEGGQGKRVLEAFEFEIRVEECRVQG
jgi:hypothetical protein